MVNRRDGKDKDGLKEYILIMEEFLSGRLSALEFEKLFLELHRNDTHSYTGDAHKYLSILFSDVDSFCGTAEIRDSGDIDETELRERVFNALLQFKQI